MGISGNGVRWPACDDEEAKKDWLLADLPGCLDHDGTVNVWRSAGVIA